MLLGPGGRRGICLPLHRATTTSNPTKTSLVALSQYEILPPAAAVAMAAAMIPAARTAKQSVALIHSGRAAQIQSRRHGFPTQPATSRGGRTKHGEKISSSSSNFTLSATSSGTSLALSNRQHNRLIHSSDRRTTTLSEQPHPIPDPLALGTDSPVYTPNMGRAGNIIGSGAPLSMLPLSMIIRSLATTTVSSSPFLLPPSLHLMTILAHATSPFLNPDPNPLLRYFLKKSFYAQFCAGENGHEVTKTVDKLKHIGFTGVILGYAREVVLTEEQARSLGNGKIGEETQDCIDNEIAPWAEGTLETVRLAKRGDFVALK